jgi:hypothetical protein
LTVAAPASTATPTRNGRTWVPRLLRRALIAVIAVVAAVVTLVPAVPASAAVSVNGPYSIWRWPASTSGFYNVDQRLTVLGHDPGIRRFWAQQFAFDAGDGGYIGLQIGSSPNNTKIALFSIFNANGHAGPNCGSGSELGTPFHTCRIDPYNWVVGRTYRLRVWVVGTDSAGEWWGAWVQDTVTGVDSYIGSLRVPLSWNWLDPWVSWTERFGAAAPTCAAMGWSRAAFQFPTANNDSVSITGHSHDIGAGDCPGYTRIIDANGADIQEMGRLG